MRALTALLLLCLPLAAGDHDWLEATTKRFASDRAEVREAASQAIRARLERELAPLLAAMKSSDPEVARRARAALESLLPAAPEREQGAQGQEDGQGGVVMVGGIQAQRIQIVMRNPGKGGKVQWVLQPAAAGEARSAELQKLGLGGHALEEGLIRKQLRVARGRGFVITKVVPARAAGKFGFRKDDILLSVNGKPVKQLDQVVKALGKMGRKELEAVVLREGKPVTLSWKKAR